MPDVWEDTRQQRGKHEAKRAWFETHGVEVGRRKLATGDYERADGASNILVDTKRSISELAMDCGRDHARFVRELDRARDAGCRLVILTEVGWPYRSVEDVGRWTNDACKRCDERRMGRCEPLVSIGCRKYRHKPMTGATLAKIMAKLEADHGCRFEFVHPAHAARRICELLGIEWR